MKKWFLVLVLIFVLVVGLVVCGFNNGLKDEKKIVVGVFNMFYVEILE